MLKSFIDKLLTTKGTPIEEEATNEDIIELKSKPLDKDIHTTIQLLEKLYTIDQNADVTVRHFTIGGIQKDAALFFISSSIDEKVIEEHLLKPMILNTKRNTKVANLVTAREVTPYSIFGDVISQINNGKTLLFIQGHAEAYSIETIKFQGRSVETPTNEVTLKGPHEAFIEDIETNISLVRKRIKDENLIFESIPISERVHNTAYLTYIKDLTNEDLIIKIRKMLKDLDSATIDNLAILEQHIDERPMSLFSTILYTERPDRVTTFLEKGHIVILMENSPAALILPATFWMFFHSEEDNYNRVLHTNFARILRLLALFITMSISAYYVAVTHFHAEMIPYELLLAIAQTRQKVPFSPIIEVIIMQISFELIREAGLRVPSPIGPTIGIVGALILGQAAVEANIVSPIVVIIVALDGLSSFAVGDLSLNFAIRMYRFASLIAAASFGILGIVGLYVMTQFYLVSYTSFGVPYFSPKTPYYQSSQDTFIKGLLRNEVFRPGYLKPKDMTEK